MTRRFPFRAARLQAAAARIVGLLLMAGVVWTAAPAKPAIAQAVPDMPEPSDTDADADAVPSLSGQVVIGPVCPVVRIDQPDQCADQPYQAVLSIRSADDDREIAQLTTDPDGAFTIDLPAGTYLVVPLTPPGRILPRGLPQTLTIDPAMPTTVVVHYDSGIR